MRLDSARQLAVHLVDYMRHACERIEVAGSVRRESPEVKDLEIVAIPRYEERNLEGVLFDFSNTVNLLHESLKASEFIRWIKPGTSEIEPWPIQPDGKYWRGLIGRGRFGAPADIKLDLFLAKPDNWGVIFAIRTGSADFSRALVTYARDRTSYRVDKGYLKQNPAHADFDNPIPCREEAELFARLGLEFVAPAFRRDDRDVRKSGD